MGWTIIGPNITVGPTKMSQAVLDLGETNGLAGNWASYRPNKSWGPHFGGSHILVGPAAKKDEVMRGGLQQR